MYMCVSVCVCVCVIVLLWIYARETLGDGEILFVYGVDGGEILVEGLFGLRRRRDDTGVI